MSPYDDAIRRLQEMERILGPLRDFERLYGRGLHEIFEDIQARERLLQRQLPELSSSYLSAILSLRPAIDTLRDLEHSPAFAALSNANSRFSDLLGRRADLESVAQASRLLGPQWESTISAYRDLAGQVPLHELALKAHYTAFAETALLAQERLFAVPWRDLGAATALHPDEFVPIRDGFTSLAHTYGSLIRSFEEREHFLASFPPIVSEAPPIEVLTSARVLDFLSRPDAQDSYPEAEREVEAGIAEEIESSLEELLSGLNPELVAMWRGAREALRSSNPDRFRHIAFSLRELVTHVVHILAPTEAVKEWSSDPDHYDNGHPTREARLLFVCRGVDHGPFSQFIRVDARASVSLIRLFQRGHELSVSFSEDQVRVLVTRTESLLRCLILTSRVTP